MPLSLQGLGLVHHFFDRRADGGLPVRPFRQSVKPVIASGVHHELGHTPMMRRGHDHVRRHEGVTEEPLQREEPSVDQPAQLTADLYVSSCHGALHACR